MVSIKSIYRDQAGASAVEFALTLPVFLLLVMGVVEGALLMRTELGLQNGVEKAARCASVNETLCADVGAVRNYAAQSSYGLNPPPSVFSVSDKSCGNEVSANFEHQFLFKIFGKSSIALSAQSCFPSSS